MADKSIFDGVDELINKKLGTKDFGTKESCISLSKQSLLKFNGHELIASIYGLICKNRNGSDRKASKEKASKENWRWEQQIRIDPDSTSEEKKMEKSIVRCMDDDWVNQIPVASGVIDSGGRKIAIDLGYRCVKGKAYDLIELKVASDTPLYAAMEILKYGITYIFSRVNQSDLGYASMKPKELLQADEVTLCVLAPPDFYFNGDEPYELEWLAEGINSGIETFARERVPSLKMSFRFEVCFPEDIPFENGNGIIKKQSKKCDTKDKWPLSEWVHFQDRCFRPKASNEDLC